ncbi:MAG: hypothetical protein V3U64_01555 [Cocleimonas sp.]
MAKTSKTYNIIAATSAFIVWGGWSYYINSLADKNAGIVSGLTQGIASFLMTLLVVLVVTKIYNNVSHDFLKIILPAFITVSGNCILLIAVHNLVGTPNILMTIAPSLTVAFIFCIITALNLRQNEKLS